MGKKDLNLIYLEKLNFSEQIKKLEKDLAGKRILLYGAGLLFKTLKKHYSLDALNIIGIVDKNFFETNEEYFEGYKTYTPDQILELEPDYILVTTKIHIYVVEFLSKNFLFSSKTKIRSIFKKPFNMIVKELLETLDAQSYLEAFKRVFNNKLYEITNLSFFNRKFLLKNRIQDFVNRKRFELRKITKPTVLVVEINSCHGETIPSIYKYFSELNYEVDFLINSNLVSQKVLDCIKCNKKNVFGISIKNIDKCVQDEVVKKYDYIFFNSYHIYKIFKVINLSEVVKVDLFDERILKYVHHIELYDKENNGPQCFILADLPNNINAKLLNPHYFGDVKITQKNEITNFIITKKKQNLDLLINAIEKLRNKGIDNFKITIIGTLKFGIIPEHLKHYFDIKGFVDYPTMYKEMEKSDFLLTLFEQNNKEHNRYITNGTSGSFQLSYGFCKPCLIQEKFAMVHGFNNENSLVYKNDDDLADYMEKAINLSQNDYQLLQNNLESFAKELDKTSFKNLKEAIK